MAVLAVGSADTLITAETRGRGPGKSHEGSEFERLPVTEAGRRRAATARRQDVVVPVDGGTSTTVRRVDGPAAITGRRRLRVPRPRPSIRNRTARSFATAATRTQVVVVVVWPR